MSNCQDRPTFFTEALWKALMNLPALRYMKAPVDTVAQLYEKYPIGNEKGTFAFVHNENTFYTYHPIGWHRGEWKPISADSVSSFFEIDSEFLKEGDILVYDSNKKKFVVKSGNIWNKLIDKASSIIQTNRFFNEVEEIPTDDSDSGIYFVHNNEESDSNIIEFRALYIVLDTLLGKKVIKIWNSTDYYTAIETQDKLDRKANQTQVNDIAASVDVLAVTKAEKSVVDALMNGIIKQPAVNTYSTGTNSLSAIYGLTPTNNGSNGKAKQNGWDVLVRNDETKGGVSNRYNWNGSVWVDMETGLYDDAILYSSIYPYKEGEKGAHIPVLKNAIKGLYIYPEFMNPNYGYFIGSIIHKSDLSQITLYYRDSSGGIANIERFEFAEDANNGTSRLHQGLRFSIVIDWSEIPLGSEFTNMFEGYELDSLCFSNQNTLIASLDRIAQQYPYKSTARGVNLEFVKRGVKNIFVDPQIVEVGKKYYLTAIIRNVNGKSQVTLFSKRDSDGATSNLESIIIDGDAANGDVRVHQGKKFAVKINWDALRDVYSYTNMFDGYELDEACFSYDNELSKLFAYASQKYPYSNQSTGQSISILHQAILNVFIHPHIKEGGKKYYLTVIRKNDAGVSQIGVYSKRTSDGATSLIESLYPTDVIGIKTEKCKSFSVKINWDMLKDGAKHTNMFDGYELDEACFSYDNELYTSVSYAECIKSGSLPMPMTLSILGYIDKRNGYLSTAPNWYSSDYIPVREGDKIRILTDVYGNGTILGYPNKEPKGFKILHDTDTSVINNKIVLFDIPNGVNYIRVCRQKATDVVLQWLKGTPPLLINNIVTTSDLHIQAKQLTSQLIEANILKFQPKFDMPNEENSISLVEGKLCVMIEGKVYELNMTEKQ